MEEVIKKANKRLETANAPVLGEFDIELNKIDFNKMMEKSMPPIKMEQPEVPPACFDIPSSSTNSYARPDLNLDLD